MWTTTIALGASALFLAFVVAPRALPEPKAHHGRVPVSTSMGALAVILVLFAAVGAAMFSLLAHA